MDDRAAGFSPYPSVAPGYCRCRRRVPRRRGALSPGRPSSRTTVRRSIGRRPYLCRGAPKTRVNPCFRSRSHADRGPPDFWPVTYATTLSGVARVAALRSRSVISARAASARRILPVTVLGSSRRSPPAADTCLGGRLLFAEPDQFFPRSPTPLVQQDVRLHGFPAVFVGPPITALAHGGSGYRSRPPPHGAILCSREALIASFLWSTM